MRPFLCTLAGRPEAREQLGARDHEDAAEMFCEARWGRGRFGQPRRVRVWVETRGTAPRLYSVKCRAWVFDCTHEIRVRTGRAR